MATDIWHTSREYMSILPRNRQTSGAKRVFIELDGVRLPHMSEIIGSPCQDFFELPRLLPRKKGDSEKVKMTVASDEF